MRNPNTTSLRPVGGACHDRDAARAATAWAAKAVRFERLMTDLRTGTEPRD